MFHPLGYWAIVVHVLLASFAFAEDFTASVVAVIDGDSIRVMHGGRAEDIRLNGIDCPEEGQDYFVRAKQAMSELVFGKDVTLQTYSKDKDGRTIADVFLPDGTDVNHQLVKDGWCWWYPKYAPHDAELERLESEARDAKKGLWQDPLPVPPWAYRRAMGG
jgi:endonuclease YncB( thermonuclease family)